MELVQPSAAELVFGTVGILAGILGIAVPLFIAIIVVTRLGRIAANTERTAAVTQELVALLREQRPGTAPPPT